MMVFIASKLGKIVVLVSLILSLTFSIYQYGVNDEREATEVVKLQDYKETRRTVDEAINVKRTVDDALDRLRAF